MVKVLKKNIVAKERKLGKMVLTGALIAAGSTSAFASSANSFGDLFTTFTNWLTGNLGKLLALLGFAGTFVVYMMTHRGSVLFIGLVISLIAGGMVGISESKTNAPRLVLPCNIGKANKIPRVVSIILPYR